MELSYFLPDVFSGSSEEDGLLLDFLADDQLGVNSFNPEQPRDERGRWDSGGGILDRAKSVGAAIGHAEHVAKEYVSDKISQSVDRLPKRAQTIVKGAYVALRTGTSAAFATWKAGQSFDLS